MQAINRYVDTTMSAGEALVSWAFTCTLDGGTLTFTYTPGTYMAEYQYGPNAGFTLSGVTMSQPWGGQISPVGNTFFVSFVVLLIITPPFPGLELLCNGVHQEFKIGDNLHKD